MKILKLITLVMWLIAGTATLRCEEVPKLSYFLIWICFIIHLIIELF